MNTEITELAKALSNVNINSDTAVQIAEAYFRYQYIQLMILASFLFGLLAVCAGLVWSVTRDS